MILKYVEPYKTAFLRLRSYEALETELKKYSITLRSPEELTYNCTFSSAMFQVITGKNLQERNLSFFDLPFSYTQVNGMETIAIDARQYCKKIDNNFINIKEVITDKYNYNFLVMTGLLCSKVKEDQSPISLEPVKGAYITLFSKLLTAAINHLVKLTPVNDFELEYAMAMYAYMNFKCDTDCTEGKNLKDMVNYLSTRKYTINTTRDVYENLTHKILTNVNFKAEGLRLLESFIFSVMEEGYRKMVNIESVNHILARAWPGPGGKNTMLAALECFPLFIAMMYTAGEQPFLRNNFLIGTVLAKNDKLINIKVVNKFLEDLVKKNYGELIE